jgi:hypothetical protein
VEQGLRPRITDTVTERQHAPCLPDLLEGRADERGGEQQSLQRLEGLLRAVPIGLPPVEELLQMGDSYGFVATAGQH